MQNAFEVRSFPDLSLPKYYDLFGDEALSVAATKLFSWFQLTACAHKRFAFVLRYRYDPTAARSNQRLRVYVTVNTLDGDTGSIALPMGRRLAETTLDISDVSWKDARPATADFEHLAMLVRKDYVVFEESDVFFLPAIWTRDIAARTAMEPYIDEAFASLGSPAFLDIQLYGAEPDGARQALRAAMLQLEHRQTADTSSANDYLEHYRKLYDSIATDPVCHLLICAGSRQPGIAEGLLQMFGVDAIGGARFEVQSVNRNDDLHQRVRLAVTEGVYDFSDPEGWYKDSLPHALAANKIALSDPQLQKLRGLSELSVLAGHELTRDVLTLPIPRRGYLRTFPLETELDRSSSAVAPTTQSGSVILGKDLERQANVSLPVGDLTRHGFVAGVTGSGKTVTMFNIIRQLGEQQIPFVVFEPAKSEYRGLSRFAQIGDDLRIYTPGREDIHPIRINPFGFEPHITLSEHLANLVAAFSCALSLFSPLPSILEEALWSIYESKGWQEDDTGSARFDVPRVDELPAAIEEVINSLNYDPEVMGRFKGAFRSRFIPLSRGSVGRLFDCQFSSPTVSDLCKSMSVIELGRLTQQQANLVTMFTMISIREHLRDSSRQSSLPRLVIVLEEAHNLVPAVPDQLSEGEESSARLEASRYIASMLAEMRALGLSIVVVDQTPAAVSQQVIRNTNLKIAHRTVAKEDRDALADAMLMHPAHAELLGRLIQGQAYVYSDRFFRPHLMQSAFAIGDVPVPKGRSSTKGESAPLPIGSIPDSELRKWLAARKWFKETIKERCQSLQQRSRMLLDDAESSVATVRDYLSLIGAIVRNDAPDHELLEELVHTERELLSYGVRAIDELSRRLRSVEVECRALDQAAISAKVKPMDHTCVGLASDCLDAIRLSVSSLNGRQ